MGGEGGSAGRDRAVDCLWGCDGEEASEEREGGGHQKPEHPKGDVGAGAQREV